MTTLLTPRLKLRPHTLEDVPFMVALNADPEVVRYVGGESVDAAQAMDIMASLLAQMEAHGTARLVVSLRDSDEKVGWCGLKWLEDEQRVDLGYRLFRRHWGRGYATEASAVCLHHGFTALGLTDIIARVHPDNAASRHVLEKLAFRRVGEDLQFGTLWHRLELRRDAWAAKTGGAPGDGGG